MKEINRTPLSSGAGTYEDMRTVPHHVFRIVGETLVSFHKKAKFIYGLQNLLKSILIIHKEIVKKFQNVLADFSFKNYAGVPG